MKFCLLALRKERSSNWDSETVRQCGRIDWIQTVRLVPCSWPISTPMERWKCWWARDDGQLAALEGRSGEQRWTQTLKNSGWGAKVSGLAVADLKGQGRTSVIASTVGWYINAFAADGTLEWAEWVRYHAITALAVADVDGDGQAEVIAGTEYSTPLNVHNSDGSFRWTTFEEVGSEGNATTPRRRHWPYPSATGRCR